MQKRIFRIATLSKPFSFFTLISLRIKKPGCNRELLKSPLPILLSMKGNKTLRDPEVYGVLAALDEEFIDKSIRYAIIGGLGVQIHLAGMLGKEGKYPVNKCPGLEDLLRRTGDVDVIVRPTEEISMCTFFNYFSALYPHFKVFNGTDHALVAGLVINYLDSPQKLKGFGYLFSTILDKSESVLVSFGNKTTAFSVQAKEYLIAAKLSGDRLKPKDSIDVQALLKAAHEVGRPLNYEIITRVLQEVNKSERIPILEGWKKDYSEHRL